MIIQLLLTHILQRRFKCKAEATSNSLTSHCISLQDVVKWRRDLRDELNFQATLSEDISCHKRETL